MDDLIGRLGTVRLASTGRPRKNPSLSLRNFPRSKGCAKIRGPASDPSPGFHVRSRMHGSSRGVRGDNAAGKIAGAVHELGQFV